MKQIIVPTDFSESAVNAGVFAMAFAKDLKAKVIITYALETPVVFSDVSFAMPITDYSELRKLAERDMKSYFKKISKNVKNIPVEMIIQDGLPSARIKELALEKKADFIVMGTTGKGVIERVLIGSNAARVIRKAPCQVIAVPPKAKYSGMKKIAYATDMTPENIIHANDLVQLAEQFKSEIVFINVKYDPDISHLNENEMMTTLKQHALYKKISAHLFNDFDVERGLNNYFKKNKVDCLAFYTHHRSFMQRLNAQSFTEYFSFHSSVPLLVIHENDI